MELRNSLLSNIIDNCDSNEKQTNKQKTQVEIFKNMGGNAPGGFTWGEFDGWEFS